MRRVSKNLVRIIIALVALVVVIVGLILFFFISNDAPIVQGEVIREIAYNKDQTLDIYLPTHTGFEKTPVVVYIHGGAWITGRKEVINFNRINEAINRLREMGYAVVSPSYTLASRTKSPFPDCIIDIYDVIGWIAESAAIYNFDLDNIGLIGESAGAHIAMLVAYADRGQFSGQPYKQSDIKYVVDIYGPTDLRELYHMQTVEEINKRLEKLPEGLRKYLDISSHLFGFDPEQDTIKANLFTEKYSPVNYVNKQCPPTLIIQGAVDQIVPAGQSVKLAEALEKAHVAYKIHLLPNVNHALRGINEKEKADVQDWIVNFIVDHYFQTVAR